MAKTITTKYDVAEHLRSPEEMAAYLEACLEVSGAGTGLTSYRPTARPAMSVSGIGLILSGAG